MKKIFYFFIVCIFFVSCGIKETNHNEFTDLTKKEYQIVLEDVFETLDLSEMEEFISRYGEKGYHKKNELFTEDWFFEENIYLDKNNFSVAYEDYGYLKQNCVYLEGDICTEELAQEFVEQFESHYSIKMEEKEKWEDGYYVFQNYYKGKGIIYYIAFTKYDMEKEIIIGIARGEDEVLEEQYKSLVE